MRAENIPEKHVRHWIIETDVIDTREWKISNDVVVFITNTKINVKDGISK